MYFFKTRIHQSYNWDLYQKALNCTSFVQNIKLNLILHRMLKMHVLVHMGMQCQQGESVNIYMLQKWPSRTHGPWCRRSQKINSA